MLAFVEQLETDRADAFAKAAVVQNAHSILLLASTICEYSFPFLPWDK